MNAAGGLAGITVAARRTLFYKYLKNATRTSTFLAKVLGREVSRPATANSLKVILS